MSLPGSAAEPLGIQRVTVLEDRAQVLRKGQLQAVGASHLLELELSPVLADKSLSLRVTGAELVSSRIERSWVQRAPETDEAVLEERLAQAKAALSVLQRSHRAQQAEAQLWQRSQELHLAELGEDVAWGRVDEAAWAQGLDTFAAEEARVREALVRNRHEQERAQRALADLMRRLEEVRSPASRARLVLRVELAGTGGPAQIELEYLVPCACWRPWHQATLQGEQLAWRSDACVWQNTGEDWHEVELFVSTERPSLGVEPPKLSTERLSAQKVGKEVQVETREQDIRTTGLGGSRTSSSLPGVDDGGQARRLGGQRATVPSDGRPHRVPLFTFQAPATLDLQLKAQLAQAVILRSEAQHSGQHPILAGPVDLVRDSGFVGRTSILFVAPGERFELGWGPDPALRVHREERQEALESRMLSSWSSTEHKVELKLSNIGPEPRTVQVIERVPVSEVEKVQVELPQDRADADGFVRWTVELAAYGTQALDLRWRLKKHDDVRGV